MPPNTPSNTDPFSGDWNDSFLGDYLWSNANFGEAVSQPMTPLAWSVLAYSLSDWVFLPGYSTVGNIAGLPYVNISIFASLFQAVGRSRQDLLDSLEATLYMPLPEAMEIPQIPLAWHQVLAGGLASARTGWRQQRGARCLPNYLAGNQTWFEAARSRLAEADSVAALANLWRRELAPHLLAGVWTVLGTVTRAANTMLALRRKLEALAGPQDANLLIANLNAGERGEGLLASLGPVAGLAQVAAGELSRSDYLVRYGHRGPHEFEISLPRPAEDPAWLEAELARLQADPLDIAGMLASQQARFSEAWGRLAAKSPRQAHRLKNQIARSAHFARQREAARSEYVRDRWMVRLFALKAGEIIGLGDEIFFLSLAEVLALLDGCKPASLAAIPARREAHQRNLSLPPLPAIIHGRFDPYQWASDPQRRADIFDTDEAIFGDQQQANRLILKGSPGSSGRVTGRVRILSRPEEGDQLQPGEILVASQTDVAWTLLFPRAAAVITDVGAPLSHAAIVARELGIPAVVGCGIATQRLKTGDRVEVDGGRGEIRIIEDF
ncbi:MAG: PEP-utilizing enzyme [Anaerolineae bacterium]